MGIAADLALIATPAASKRSVWGAPLQHEDDFARMTPRKEFTNNSEVEHTTVLEPVEELEDKVAYVAARKARRAARKAKKSYRDEDCAEQECENEEKAALRRARRAARKVAKAAETEAARQAGKASWAEKKKVEAADCIIFEKPPKQLPPLSFRDDVSSANTQLPPPISCW